MSNIYIYKVDYCYNSSLSNISRWMLWQPLVKRPIVTQAINLKDQVGLTRELDKESPIYSYTIYTKYSWSVLMINSPTLIFICSPCFHYASISCLL